MPRKNRRKKGAPRRPRKERSGGLGVPMAELETSQPPIIRRYPPPREGEERKP